MPRAPPAGALVSGAGPPRPLKGPSVLLWQARRAAATPVILVPEGHLYDEAMDHASTEQIVDASEEASLGVLANGESSENAAVAGAQLRHPRWNFGVLAFDHVVLRIGWIFKTESIIIPAVLDALSGAGWLRGCLPLLNRLGQSVPPLMAAPLVLRARRKRSLLVLSGALMAVCFAVLSFGWAWRDKLGSAFASALFLAVYAVFFATTGIHQLVFNTLQGKLIPVSWRGRLMLVSNVVGAPAAIAFAWWLLPKWLERDSANFSAIFGFSAAAFALAAATGWLLREPPDAARGNGDHDRMVFRSAWGAVRADRRLRQLVGVAMCFGSCMVLFPHYQALGRSPSIGFDMRSLMQWVVIQNLGTALFSMALGPIADRWGNRRVLLLGLIGVAATPWIAVGSAYAGSLRYLLFHATFLMIGLTPVMYRVLFNFSLELTDPDGQPKYLSVLGVAVSLPSLLAPLVGRVIDAIGFTPVFVFVSFVLCLGWLLAVRMPEPRWDEPT